MKKLFLLALIASLAMASHDAKLWSRSHDGFTRYVDIAAGSSGLGPTAPTTAIIGTSFALCFDANAEKAGVKTEIPADWVGGEDMYFKIYWTNQSGDALEADETIKLVITYRVIDFENGEVITNGTAVADTLTYTQSGAGTDLETHETIFTLDYDNANQPLTVGQRVGIIFNRSMTTDTYAGDLCVEIFEVKYTANDLIIH